MEDCTFSLLGLELMKAGDSVGARCRLLGRLLALLGFVGVGVVDAVAAKAIICCGGNSALNGDSM